MFADLHVIAVVSNPERYRSRYTLYSDFEKHVIDSGAKLYTVEAAFGERPYAVTCANNPMHIQLRTSSQIWHKENMINLGTHRLPHDWKYMAWVDADVHFARPDWVAETIHQLQHFSVVQMYSHAMDLKHTYIPIDKFYSNVVNAKPASWCYCYVHDLSPTLKIRKYEIGDYPCFKTEKDTPYYWHPGFAWAIRRDAYDALGGLMDYHILGSADYIMAAALTGTDVTPTWSTPSVKRKNLEWKGRADRYIRGNIGYVPGILLHNWHGRKADRRYSDRWKILRDNNFDPDLDLKPDWQGLYQLTDRNSRLRDEIRLYFRSRNEDSID